jgi:hypothetical protein
MSEFEIVYNTLKQIGLKVSFQTAEHIIVTYHSCALEGSTLTLEETAKVLGYEIIKELKENKTK